MLEFEAAEKELYELAAWLVNDAVRLKAHVAQCCAWARDCASSKAPLPGLLLPFPTHTLVSCLHLSSLNLSASSVSWCCLPDCAEQVPVACVGPYSAAWP